MMEVYKVLFKFLAPTGKNCLFGFVYICFYLKLKSKETGAGTGFGVDSSGA